MIDIEKLKEGQTVWILNRNKPESFISKGIIEHKMASGIQINVLGECFNVPADYCYFSEMELIEDQINYWRDMRLMKIVKDNA